MLNGKDGAKAGVISAMIAESLGDLVRAQSKETFAHLREQYPDDEDYNDHVEAYLLQQKDLLLLTTAGITTGLGLDVDTAIDVADNALTHNWLQTALENAAEYATDLAMENPENLEEIKHHILGEVSVEALEDCAAWIEAHPDEVALGVATLMGAMDRNAEDRGAPVKDSKVQRRAKEKMLVKAITQSPTLLKDMVTKAKGGGKGVAGKGGTPQTFNPKYWTKHDTHTFHGQTNKVYKRDDLIDLGMIGKDGRSNLQRMSSGDAPLGHDKRPINLHHTVQTQDRALAEVTATMHSQNHGTLHIWPNGSSGGVTRAEVRPRIDRIAFDKWKSDYWKARAKELGEH